VKSMWCTFHSIYYELRASTCFEFILRTRCTIIYCVHVMSVPPLPWCSQLT
jgi:hypothetical protein